MDIERALKRIVELLRLKRRRKPEVFHGTATTIDQCFNLEQRRILFELLDDRRSRLLADQTCED
jgi:hypothetical protein